MIKPKKKKNYWNKWINKCIKDNQIFTIDNNIIVMNIV